MSDRSDAEFEIIAEVLRRMKLERVLEHGNDPDEEASDLDAECLVCRDGQVVAQVFAGPGPDGVREAGYYSALLMRPHEVFVVADSHMIKATDKNEVHDMRRGQLRERWVSGHRKGISECLVVYRFPRIGQPSGRIFPYERRGTHIKWHKGIDPEVTLEGAIPDYVAEGYRRAAPFWDEAGKHFGDADDDDLDRGAGRFVSSMCGAVLLADGSMFVAGEECPPEP
jgi:hypothetical protein